MGWETLSLHFKQQFDGAYRYLDRCGEFMVVASDELGFIPIEAHPSGAKLDIPERGVKSTADSSELVIFQELPGDDTEYFLKICTRMSQLAEKYFQPRRVTKNGFASKSYWALGAADKVLAASLQFGGDAHTELAKIVGMVPENKRLHFNFVSGSKDLRVQLQPVTFDKISITRRTASFDALDSEKEKVDRLNKSADRFNNVVLGHALVLEVDVMESNPPGGSLPKHFQHLMKLGTDLRQHYTVK